MLALLLSTAMGSIAIGRWKRALFWLLSECGWYLLLVLAIFGVWPRLLWIAMVSVVVWRFVAAADAYVQARRSPRRASWLTLVVCGCAIYATSLVGALLTRDLLVEAFVTRSASMLPTLVPGDHFFVDKSAHDCEELAV